MLLLRSMYNNNDLITIGVLLVGNSVQYADISPVDVINTLSTGYISLLEPFADAVKVLAVPMNIIYITENGSSPFALTGNVKINIEHSIQSAPKLDILIVPGPPPSYRASEPVKTFIKSTHATGAHVLSICSGILAVAASGILDGKNATGPLGMVPLLHEIFPKVQWHDTRRVEKVAAEGDGGDIWSSGSILDGVDLAVAFMRDKFPVELVEPMIFMAGVSERPIEYSQVEKQWAAKLMQTP